MKQTDEPEEGITLHSVLQAFNSPINEEQAWAICYQSVQYTIRQVQQGEPIYPILTKDNLFITTDGRVRIQDDAPQPFLPPAPSPTITDAGHSSTASIPSEVECKFIGSLGLILFQALDYGLEEHEERCLDPSLEILIDRLTFVNKQSDVSSDIRSHDGESVRPRGDRDRDETHSCDEGIERDSGDPDDHPSLGLSSGPTSHDEAGRVSLETILEMCSGHLSVKMHPDTHYQAVCRALVVESLELSAFLKQISQGTQELKALHNQVINNRSSTHQKSGKPLNSLQQRDLDEGRLEQLNPFDWARLWMQVIRELRNGVKLKKTLGKGEDLATLHTRSTVYELTPYEMLLNDIRSQKYKLRQVMVNGQLPLKNKKDAHALILEFIRSRPPLVPVSHRMLGPLPPKQQTMYDKLMQSIRSQQHSLRPTPLPERKRPHSIHLGRVCGQTVVETSRTKMAQEEVTPAPRRRLIKADINLHLSESFDDDLDDLFSSVNRGYPNHQEVFSSREDPELSLSSSSYSSSGQPSYHPESSNPSQPHSQITSHGTSSGSKSKTDQPDSSAHSTTTPVQRRFSFKSTVSRFLNFDRRHSITICETPDSGHNKRRTRESNNNLQGPNGEDIIVGDPNEDTRDRVANIWAATDWGKSFDCLSLTLDEVQHIRSVLTKAEMESLGVTKSLREDLEKGRICFTCLKTRFSFFGPWRIECKLCERSICEKCSTRMTVPSECLAKVPIYMLSPTSTPSPPGDRGDDFFPRFPSPSNLSQGASSSHKGSQGKKSRLLKAFTLSSTNKDVTSTSTSSSSSPLPNQHHHHGNETKGGLFSSFSSSQMKLCRDCKLLVRHIIDVGHTNYDSTHSVRKHPIPA